MISKNNIKYVRSLHQKKFRDKFNSFITEGSKNVLELLQLKRDLIETVYATEPWIKTNEHHFSSVSLKLDIISEKDMERITALKSPSPVLAVATKFTNEATNENGFSLYLEQIKNPGNMGTIIRIADWFGMDQIICSEECVEIFSPKVVQASMGSLFRMSITTAAFDTVAAKYPEKVYGTVLEGTNVFEAKIKSPALIVIGNESKGISDTVQKQLNHKISIPAAANSQAESLNAAIAAGIVCAAINNM